MHLVLLLADVKEDINQFLENNPVILGLGAMGLGLLIGGIGAAELATGISRDRRGNVMEGSSGKVASWVRLIFGIGLMGFGMYKLVAG